MPFWLQAGRSSRCFEWDVFPSGVGLAMFASALPSQTDLQGLLTLRDLLDFL